MTAFLIFTHCQPSQKFQKQLLLLLISWLASAWRESMRRKIEWPQKLPMLTRSLGPSLSRQNGPRIFTPCWVILLSTSHGILSSSFNSTALGLQKRRGQSKSRQVPRRAAKNGRLKSCSKCPNDVTTRPPRNEELWRRRRCSLVCASLSTRLTSFSGLKPWLLSNGLLTLSHWASQSVSQDRAAMPALIVMRQTDEWLSARKEYRDTQTYTYLSNMHVMDVNLSRSQISWASTASWRWSRHFGWLNLLPSLHLQRHLGVVESVRAGIRVEARPAPGTGRWLTLILNFYVKCRAGFSPDFIHVNQGCQAWRL